MLSNIQEVNSTTGATTEHESLFFNKYKDIQTTETRRYMIPLLRMSEIYLIAAESTSDVTEGLGYVNAIREHRNCVNIDAATVASKEDLQEYIDNEFYRETIGEGQIYFYYKRHARASILGGSAANFEEDWYGDVDPVISMTLEDYIWPLPKVETDKRIN